MLVLFCARKSCQLEIVTLLFVLLADVSLFIRVVSATHRQRVRRVDVKHDYCFDGKTFLVPNTIALDAGASNESARSLTGRRFLFATCASMARAYLAPRAVLKRFHACRVEVFMAGCKHTLDSVLKGKYTEADSALHLIAFAQITKEIIAGNSVDAQAGGMKAAAARATAHDELAHVVTYAAMPVIVILHPHAGHLRRLCRKKESRAVGVS